MRVVRSSLPPLGLARSHGIATPSVHGTSDAVQQRLSRFYHTPSIQGQSTTCNREAEIRLFLRGEFGTVAYLPQIPA